MTTTARRPAALDERTSSSAATDPSRGARGRPGRVHGMSRGDEARNRRSTSISRTAPQRAATARPCRGCDLVATTSVPGTLTTSRTPSRRGSAGNGRIEGEWRCPADRLPAIDAYEGTPKVCSGASGYVDEWALDVRRGPRLARRLKPSCKAAAGRAPAAAAAASSSPARPDRELLGRARTTACPDPAC